MRTPIYYPGSLHTYTVVLHRADGSREILGESLPHSHELMKLLPHGSKDDPVDPGSFRDNAKGDALRNARFRTPEGLLATIAKDRYYRGVLVRRGGMPKPRALTAPKHPLRPLHAPTITAATGHSLARQLSRETGLTVAYAPLALARPTDPPSFRVWSAMPVHAVRTVARCLKPLPPCLSPETLTALERGDWQAATPEVLQALVTVAKDMMPPTVAP